MVGTGFFIDADGYILTNEHVIGDSQALWVTTDDRTVYPAIVVGSDPRTDLAVLKIARSNTLAVTFASLPDGTNYAASTDLKAQGKNMEIKTQNSNYQKIGQ